MPRGTNTEKSGAPANLKPGLPTTGNANWLFEDESSLIEFLVENIAEAGDNKNLTMKTFHACADHLEPTRTKGGPKTAKSCAQKYSNLRKLQGLVDLIKAISGWKWSDEKGADIDLTTKDTWDDWVLVHSDGKRFRNKGWAHYDSLVPLMPEKAKGTHAFRGTAVLTEPTRSPSPDWDTEAMDKEFEGAHDGDGGASSEGDTGTTVNDDDDENDIASSLPAPANPRKRVAAQPAAQKKSCLSSGTQAIQELASAASDFNVIFGKMGSLFADSAVSPAAAPVAPVAGPSTQTFQTSPQHRVSAVVLAQREDWMTPEERLAHIQILTENQRLADVYPALLTEDMRIPWIISELRKVDVYVFYHKYSSGPLSTMF
ncbi:hypothetical protein K438DRAFT_2007510 [Mycena galopus ATCC 62051]|nr:hypothetical protein K438DRAFT_2007510 [Mycena galopus ATCC 62051]